MYADAEDGWATGQIEENGSCIFAYLEGVYLHRVHVTESDRQKGVLENGLKNRFLAPFNMKGICVMRFFDV